MRNRQLHAALAAFAEEAAWQLAAAAAQGEEVPFEVVAGGRRDAPLYCYRPLTGDFIARRAGLLSGLEGYPRALSALQAAGALEPYLRRRGEPVGASGRERAEAALRAFLTATFADSTDFALSPQRLRLAYAELEDAVYEGRSDVVVVAPLLGLELACSEVALGDGLLLAAGEAFPETLPAEALRAPGARRAHLLAVLRWEAAPGDAAPVAHARVRLRRLLTALRLYDSGSFAYGPLAWTRCGAGAWEPFALGATGHRRGEPLALAPGQEDELRGFCSLVARRAPRHGSLAWALRRFDMGCDRSVPAEALSDHLLALRALLEPEGPESGALARRLAALCATADERPALVGRAVRAASIERALMAGLTVDADVDDLADELAGQLRALLRDVLCGHLVDDLVEVADAILAAAAPVPPAPPAPAAPPAREAATA